MAETYATYYSRAVAGVDSLSQITDATSANDPAGTNCDKTYWEDHAYDQIRQIYLTLGSSPGTGVTGNFTLNNDASDDTEDAFLYASRGPSSPYGDAYLQWDSSETHWVISNTLVGNTVSLGSESIPWQKGWFTDLDVADTATIETLEVNDEITAVNATVTDTLTVDTFAFTGTTLTLNSDATDGETIDIKAYRGATNDHAYLRWSESSSAWMIAAPGGSFRKIIGEGDAGVITDSMLDSSIYDGTGSATTIARSDHTHTGGTLDVSGTTSDSFIIDSDWDTGNVTLSFGQSSRYIRSNPSYAYFQFSDSVYPSTDGALDLGYTTARWHNAYLSNNLYLGGDLHLSGTVSGSLTIDGDYFIVDSGSTGGLKVADTEDYAVLSYDGSNWQLDSDTIATLTATQTLSNKTLTDPVIDGALSSGTSYLNVAEKCVTLDSSTSTGAEGKLRVATSSGAYTYFGYVGSAWSISSTGASGSWHTLATLDESQTFTNKTLTSPSIVGGVISGTPSITGTLSITGSTTFTTDATHTFTYATGASGLAPFAVTKDSGIGTLSAVTNLNADLVDGIEGSDILHATTSGGDYVMSADLDTNGHDIIGIDLTPSAHASSHIDGGSDVITGNLGSVTGVSSNIFRVGTGGSSASNKLYLGNTDNFKVGIQSASGTLAIGLGGTSIHVAPYVNNSQDLGYSSNKWRTGWFSNSINLTLLATTEPSANLQNGSIWITDASSINVGISIFEVRLADSNYQIIGSNGLTSAAGSTGAWDAGGAITGDSLDVGTGAITGGNLTLSGYINGVTNVTASGSISGADITASGVLSGDSLSTTGSVAAGSLLSGTSLDINSSKLTVDSNGNLSAANITGSGTLRGATLTNTNDSGGIDGSGNITGVNLTISGALSGNTLAINTNKLTVDASGYLSAADISGAAIAATGQITGTGLNVGTGAIQGGNASVTGLTAATVTTSGNISGASLTISGTTTLSGELSVNAIIDVSDDIEMDAGKKLYLDKGSDTYFIKSDQHIVALYINGTQVDTWSD